MTQARLEHGANGQWRLIGELTLATAPELAEQGSRLIAGLVANANQTGLSAHHGSRNADREKSRSKPELDGEFDGDVGQLARHQRSGPSTVRTLQLDLSGVTRAQTVAIALMLEWQAQLRDHGFQLLIQHCPEGLRRIAQFSNVDALIGLEDHPEDP